MHKYLKEFIKDNKEFINKEQWYLVFDAWMSAADYFFPNEGTYLEELLNIFSSAGITVDMNERKKVIIDSMCDIVNIVVKDRSNWNADSISFNYICNELPSKLLFKKEEIFNFLPEVANQLNMIIKEGAIIL